MTVVLHKARENEIHLTDVAKKHILNYLTKNPIYKGIRFSVKKTGCSGLSYVVDYLESPTKDDIVISLLDEFLLCIEKKSYPYLKGMQIDFVKQGLNYKFQFKNPNQTGQCGCGESFTIE